MSDLLSLSRDQISALLVEMGESAYRAGQVFSWLHKGAGFADMSNLPAALRTKLAEKYTALPVRIERAVPSADGNTIKYLYVLEDGNIVEGVLMRYRHGNTLCVSTQVGCRMGCRFCASTLSGCVRNLTAGEMLGQVVLTGALHAGPDRRGITNLVLMGSGEPMDNYDQCVSFIRMAADPTRLGISPRNVSLSTCGVVEGIDRLSHEGLPLTLSLSLHAPNDAIRQEIMPIAFRYSIDDTLAACRRYTDSTGRRMVVEYILIQGVNDSAEHAKELSQRLRGMLAHVNLIPLNPIAERDWLPPTDAGIAAFAAELTRLGISVTRRREMGDDIEGACGQLRRRHIQESGGPAAK